MSLNSASRSWKSDPVGTYKKLVYSGSLRRLNNGRIGPVAVIILFYTLVAIWLGGEMLKPEIWKQDDIIVDNPE